MNPTPALVFAIPMPTTADDAIRLLRLLFPPCWAFTTVGDEHIRLFHNTDQCEAGADDEYDETMSPEEVTAFVFDIGRERHFEGGIACLGLGVEFKEELEMVEA